MSANRIFGVAAIAAVAGGLILAFLVIGTPGHSRLIALDERRVRDMQSIATELRDRYGDADATLPAHLPQGLERYDPSTNRPYEFRRVDAENYVLCAVFAARPQRKDASADDFSFVRTSRAWQHGTGRTCYKLNVRRSAIVPQVL